MEYCILSGKREFAVTFQKKKRKFTQRPSKNFQLKKLSLTATFSLARENTVISFGPIFHWKSDHLWRVVRFFAISTLSQFSPLLSIHEIC